MDDLFQAFPQIQRFSLFICFLPAVCLFKWINLLACTALLATKSTDLVELVQ